MSHLVNAMASDNVMRKMTNAQEQLANKSERVTVGAGTEPDES